MKPIVSTEYGLVEGIEEDWGCKWLGIPFAKPPVGNLRFKRAVPCEPWIGVRQAKEFGARPIQFAKSGAASQLPESEDCLYLNVWAPKQAKKSPVFIWIYGGGGHGGEGSAPSYGGEGFVDDGIVYISFNYRLGPLGFYNFSLYDKTFDSNCALSDVLMALKWTKKNIHEFGGDPENITICGQSAGASMVYTLMAAPKAKGLFHKAIAMSPTIGSSYQNITHDTNNRLFLEKMGISPDDMYKLKNISGEQMKDAAWHVFLHGSSARPGNTFSLCVTDDLLPVPVYEAITQGSARGIKAIFGCCLDEGSSFYKAGMYPITRESLLELLEYRGCPERIRKIDHIYPDNDEVTMKRLGGDLVFGTEVAKGLEAQKAHADVYAYRYDFLIGKSVAEGGQGVCHGSDIEIALNTYGTLLTSIFGEEVVQNANRRREAMSRIMHGAWVDFCKTGNPNGRLPIQWIPYERDEKNMFIFNENCSLEENPKNEAYRLWEEIDYYAEPQKEMDYRSKTDQKSNLEFVLP